MRAVSLVGIHAAAEGKRVRSSGPPTALRLRFPVGARIEIQNANDEWFRGTVVGHWHKIKRVAGEWAAYQLKMDLAVVNSMVCITCDNDDEIRAAPPDSPRRFVEQLRSPANSGEDRRVGYVRVWRELQGQEQSRSELITITSSAEPGEAEPSCCPNCGKVSARNRACRGCFIGHFYNSECYREGWGDHKAACRVAAATMNAPEEEAAYLAVSRALASECSPAQIPTDAQITTRMGRIIARKINLPDIKRKLARGQTPDVGFSKTSVVRQLDVDLCIKDLGVSLEDRGNWIMAEMDKYVDNLPNLIERDGGVRIRGRAESASASARGMGAVAGDDVQQRIAAAGPARMAAYWTRVGELRAAYLPILMQGMDVFSEGVKKGEQKKSDQLFTWMRTTAIPMLQQTEGSPCGLAKFAPEELHSLGEELEELIAGVMEAGRSLY